MEMTDTRPLFIRLTLPAGLEDALEGLAREVLRHQPENILEFAADHFDLQLRKRSESGVLDISDKAFSAGEDVSEIEDIEDERSSPVSNVGLEKSNIDDDEEENIQEKDDLEVVQAKLIPLTEIKDDDTEELVKDNLELIDNEEKHEANDANEGQETETYDLGAETSTPVEDFEKITENGELKILINENEESENTENQELEVEGVNQVEDLEFNNTETDTEKQDIPETDIDLNSEKIKDADEETNNDDDENKDTGLESVEDQEKAQTERADNIEDGPINEVKTDPTQTTDQPDTFVKELDKIDIDLEDIEVQQAATKIQAGFRGHKARKELKKNVNVDETTEQEQNTIELLNDDSNMDIDLMDPNVEQAATKIQAGFRGIKARQEVKKLKEQREIVEDVESFQNEDLLMEKAAEVDIDLTDSDVEKAATKIQAGFRGIKARQEVQKMKEESNYLLLDEQENTDPDVEQAATKIQAGFRGIKARQEVKKMQDERKAVHHVDIERATTEETDALIQSEPESNPEADIDFTDLDVEQASTMINNIGETEYILKNEPEPETEIDIDDTDPDVEQAATKIQAGFRGIKARQEVKKMKDESKLVFPPEEVNIVEFESILENKPAPDTEIDIDLTDPDVEQAATKIQAGFRGIKARQEVKKMKDEKVIVDQTEDIDESKLTANPLTEPEIDIDLTDPDVEQAATKIQAGFRGIKARQEVQKMKDDKVIVTQTEEVDESKPTAYPMTEPDIDIDLTDPNTEHAATKIQAGFRGSKARKEVQKMKDEIKSVFPDEEVYDIQTEPLHIPEPEVDIDLTDPDVEQAATKIQAGFRGIKARQEVKKMKDEKEFATERDTITEPESANSENRDNNVIDIDLTDPEVQEAAIKIQAGFRGIKARQEVKKIKDTNESVQPEETEMENETEEKVDIDLTDPDMELAATKIQAGFRGIKARQEVKKIRDESKLVIPPDEENTVESESILVNEPAPDPEIDIDLTDPDVEQAATKIQAGFRGIKARQEVKKMKDEKVIVDQTEDIDESKLTANPLTEPEIDIDLTDPEVEQAATKIQAGFRGIKARQEVKKMKDDKVINEQTEEVDDSKLIENPDIDIDLTDPKTEHAATKIQAGFRGSKARQEVQKMKEEIKSALPAEQVDKVETEPLLIPEPEVDIDLTDPDVEQAATKIQAGFRGIKARQKVKKMKDEKEIIQITKQEQISEQEPIPEQELADIDIDLTDPEVEQAATKIQAGFRGIKARQEVKKMKDTNESAQPEEIEMETETEEKVDIDLTDPDMELAATKIQAGFRGIKARQEVKKMKDECKSIIPLEEENIVVIESILENEPAPDPEIDIDLTDPDVEQAATKIQAGFRGIKARQEVKKMKDKKESLQITEQALIAEQEPITNQDLINAQEPITELEPTDTEKEDKDVIDIDLTDPEIEQAATKIQAGFRGIKARKEVQKMKDSNELIQPINQEETELETETEAKADIDLTDPDMELAATKIQAGFRGIKARQEVKKMQDEKEFVMITEQESAAPEIEDKNDVDIDFSDPDLEQAATKIQAGFRGLKARQEVKKMKGEEEFVQITEQEQADLKNELESEPNIDIDLTDPDVEQAATKIQAGFRGIKARKEVKKIKEESSTFLPSKQGDESKVDPLNELNYDPEINIDLTDPDVEQAATKIQAGFRGIKARQEVKKMKDESNPIISPYQEQIIKTESLLNVNPEPTPEVDSDLDCEAVVDNDNQELEDAATKIQAGFKGMKARKEVKQRKEDAKAKDDEGNMSNATEDVSAVGEEETEEGTVLGEPLGEKNDSYPSQDDGYISPLLSESTDIHTAVLAPELSENMASLPSEEEHSFDTIQRSSSVESGFSNDVNNDEKLSKEEKAATLIQAGFRGMKGRKQLKNILKSSTEVPVNEEHDTISLREKSGKVARVGAIPFELHHSFNPEDETEIREGDKDSFNRLSSEHTIDLNINRESSIVKTDEKKFELDNNDEFDPNTSIIVYMDESQPSSNVLELYLFEKKVKFVKTQVSRKRKNHLTPEFLEINPEGTLPTMLFDKNIMKAGSMKIAHFIEEHLPITEYPALIPCTNPPPLYQKYLYFSSQFDDIDMTALEIGSKLLTLENQLTVKDISEEIDEMVQLSGADDILEPHLSKVIETTKKTWLSGTESYHDLLNKVKQVLNNCEAEFAESTSSWLLGSTFTAVDIQLGVLINHLEKIGLFEIIWDGKEYLQCFWKSFKARQSVQKILFKSGENLDSSENVNESGAVRPGSGDMTRVDDEFLTLDNSTEKEEVQSRREDRTWYNLW
ncbi:kinesin-related protein 4 isoform X3 [Eurytemora carolleeae]|uniref:kinesin-related protein 4 isoform X3 n=1 Tax=Eurytemora carolleeae TaxID=1294199 RepID=UPI000C76A4E3|nr:kinesin-related protein 4 isoform X3 [Eurytemora carolleeae]|eukprot:XP_023330594.1 kinesin-related protein 4-like isoform X3 [Eurytemora affinis]